jgi:hypothetical protein
MERTENELPRCTLARIDTEDPSRAELLKENVDPSSKASRVERVLPKTSLEKIDKPLVQRAKARRDTHEPNLEAPLRLIDDPI